MDDSREPIGQRPARAIIAAVQLSSVSDPEFEASLAELRQLAKTLGFEIAGTFTQKHAKFDPAAYFGRGKCEELRLLREEATADVLLVDHKISPPLTDPERRTAEREGWIFGVR